MQQEKMTRKVVLITGAARRIGAAVARHLHSNGMDIALHYRNSADEAEDLIEHLNKKRPGSAICIKADLADISNFSGMIATIVDKLGHLDVLINNASSFYPTQIDQASESQWDDLFASNAKGAFFLSQVAAPELAKTQGCIINITDTHAQNPLKDHTIYCMAKAALGMMTKSLAKELAPDVRVNAIAPGAIIWPENESELTETNKTKIMSKTALNRSGSPIDIANAVLYFIENAPYVTGQTLNVDGGRY